MSLLNPDNAVLYIAIWAASILAALGSCVWMIKHAKNPNESISGGLFVFFVSGGIGSLLSFNLSSALEWVFKLSGIDVVIKLCVILLCLIFAGISLWKMKKISTSVRL
jgi:hypothetical protein